MVQFVLTSNDFDRILNDYFGSSEILHTVGVLAYNNISGEETITDGSSSNIKAYFVRTNQTWNWESMGFLEKGDAVMLAKYEDNVQKNDKITMEGVEYRVKERYDVQGTFDATSTSNEYVYTACNLFLIQ